MVCVGELADGRVVHFEIPAEDMARAKKFYEKFFGWKMNEVPEMNYCVAVTVETDEKGMPKTPGAINGGIAKRGESFEAPLVVAKVRDLDAKLSELQAGGVEIVMPKTAMGQMGFYAKVRDSEGNVLGVWQDAAP